MIIVWLIGAVAAAIWIVELISRHLIRFRGRYYVRTPYEHVEFDMDKSILPRMEDHVRFQVNSEGERGGEIPTHAQRLYRVLVAGGSAAECYLLDQESSWPMRVQRILQTPENLEKLKATHVHVGNIGQSSFDTESLEAVLQAILPRMPQLDAIVIFTGASDVLNWLSAGAPERVGPNPNIDPTLYFEVRPDTTFDWHPRQTALSYLLRPLRNRFIVHRRSGKAGKSLAQLRSMRAAAKEIRDRTPNPAPMLLHLEQHLENVVTLAKAAARRVIVVPQPWFEKQIITSEEKAQFWNGAVGNPHVEVVHEYYSNKVLWELFQAAEESVVRVADALAVECVDVRTKLPSSCATYYDHLHLTPAGAAIVADIVAESLGSVADDSTSTRARMMPRELVLHSGGIMHRQIRKAAVLLILTLAIGSATYVVYAERHFAPPTLLRPVPERTNCAGRPVALIGDSWVRKHALDDLIHQRTGLAVITYSHPGAKSRHLYESLLAQEVLRDAPQLCYCVVVVGTNDTTGHVGSDFYAYHMTQLVKMLTAHGIRPVVVSAPDYDISNIEKFNLPGAKHWLFRTIYDDGKQDVLQEYRTAFQRQLVEERFLSRVDVIRFSGDYATDYVADKRHLNRTGEAKLADSIASQIKHNLAAHAR